MLNIRVGGSILYHFFMDNFAGLGKIIANQNFLPPGLRNKPRKDNYKFDNRPQIIARPPEPGKDPEVFDDVFTKQELKAIFKEKANQFEDFKRLTKDFIERIDDIVGRAHKMRVEEKKKEARREYKLKIKKVIKVLKRNKIYSREEEVRDYGQEYGRTEDDLTARMGVSQADRSEKSAQK